MHQIEPHYTWQDYYIASEDHLSPFYGREYNEFEFSNVIYNYLIHPQWDNIGSTTLYIKILFANYDTGYCVIELLGEWNDCLYNDIMYLKRNIIEVLIENGINKFIFTGENLLNFHASEDDYYQEWFEETENGWIVFINFREHVLMEFCNARIHRYIRMGGLLNEIEWRGLTPLQVFHVVENVMETKLLEM
ncbi:MAG: hypothetical protein K8R53_04855 [Bacteroidales bacterium]|nr:hypothetical protein [Bacteroidales bacterium]